MPESDVIHVTRIDFGQESLSGPELRLLLARIKRLESGDVSSPDIQFVPHSVTDPTWVDDISNCIVFRGLTEDTTITNEVLANTSNVFRIGNNSQFSLTMSGTGNTFTIVPYEFVTARYVDGWVYVTGVS